jgi:uncharacterized delta-60 repeat protein
MSSQKLCWQFVVSIQMNSAFKLTFVLLLLVSLVGQAQSVVPDNSFGKKGNFYFSNGRYNEVKDIAVTADESIFVLVESGLLDSLRNIDIIVFKLSSKGIPDPKFGKEGKVQFDFYGMDISRAAEFTLLADGKILIAGDGAKYDSPQVNLSCLARILPDGSADRTFGNAGTVTLSFGKTSYLTSFYISGDHSVFVAGSYLQPVGRHTDIFPITGKINKNGDSDTSFKRSGKIWIDFNFEIFSFASIKHTAGGEIMDILVQDDGKILICGGFIFSYSYEGFIARLLPDGRLDRSFNSRGYIRHDFTPGKFNLIKKMLLYDDNTLIFGASSQTDFDSDFYFGTLNLNDYSLSVTNIDFKNQHEIFEDISLDDKEVILTGRSILPENAPLRHRSDFAAIVRIPDIKKPKNYESFIFPLSKTNQNGSMAHAVTKDKIVIGGFQHTSIVFVKDVIISRFIKKKTGKGNQ